MLLGFTGTTNDVPRNRPAASTFPAAPPGAHRGGSPAGPETQNAPPGAINRTVFPSIQGGGESHHVQWRGYGAATLLRRGGVFSPTRHRRRGNDLGAADAPPASRRWRRGG